jgi:putative intracellular protease/amidase
MMKADTFRDIVHTLGWGDCARAKYILLFVLMLLGNWSLSSAATNPRKTSKLSATVMVVVSSATTLPLTNGKTAQVGVFLGEVTETLEPMLKEGVSFVFVSPDGKAPTMDSASCKPVSFGFSKKRLNHALEVWDQLMELGMKAPKSFAEVVDNREVLSKCCAILFPGGHAPMIDVVHENWNASDAYNAQTGKLLAYFHQAKELTGLICHAPPALCAAPDENGKWMYDGYKVTCISRGEEKLADKANLKGNMKAYPYAMLQAKGAKTKFSPWGFIGKKVVFDRELMTGQNPNSARKMGKKFLEALRAQAQI